MKHIFKPYPFKITKQSNNNYSCIIMDQNNNVLYVENFKGEWERQEYDENGRQIYWEDSDGCWVKYEHAEDGETLYYETSSGLKINRKL